MLPILSLMLMSVISAGSIDYKIFVKTGNRYSTGKVRNVTLGMKGSRGYVAPTLLNKPKRDDFKPNSLDEFYISVPNPIGPICTVKLRKVNGGQWYVEYVTVVEPRSARKPKFVFEMLISAGDTNTYSRTQPAVNGNWGEWSTWSVCKNCEGSTIRKRKCNNPEPSCGGKSCDGDNDEDESCSDLHCSETDEDDEKKIKEETKEADLVIPITGAVGGFLAVTAIAVIIVYCVKKNRKSNRSAEPSETVTQAVPHYIAGSQYTTASLPPSREDVVPYSYVDYEDQSGYLDISRARRTFNPKGDQTKCLPSSNIKYSTDTAYSDPGYQTEYTGDYSEDGEGYMITLPSVRPNSVRSQMENSTDHGRQSQEGTESLNRSPLQRNAYEGSTNYMDFEHGYTRI